MCHRFFRKFLKLLSLLDFGVGWHVSIDRRCASKNLARVPIAPSGLATNRQANWSLINAEDYRRFDRKTFVNYRNPHLRPKCCPLRFRQKTKVPHSLFHYLGCR